MKAKKHETNAFEDILNGYNRDLLPIVYPGRLKFQEKERLKQLDPEVRYQYFTGFNTTTLYIRKADPIVVEEVFAEEAALEQPLPEEVL